MQNHKKPKLNRWYTLYTLEQLIIKVDHDITNHPVQIRLALAPLSEGESPHCGRRSAHGSALAGRRGGVRLPLLLGPAGERRRRQGGRQSRIVDTGIAGKDGRSKFQTCRYFTETDLSKIYDEWSQKG